MSQDLCDHIVAEAGEHEVLLLEGRKVASTSTGRSRVSRPTVDRDDKPDKDDDADDLNLRPTNWPKRRRSRKNPTDLETWKAELWRQVPAGINGKKAKLPKRKVLSALLSRQPLNGTILELLALIEILEELNPSPSPTIATLLDLEMPSLLLD